jgi:hypothetical protein
MKRLNFLKTLIGIPVAAAIVKPETEKPIRFIGESGRLYDTAEECAQEATSKMHGNITYHVRGGGIDKMWTAKNSQELVDKINNDPTMRGFVKVKLI